MTTCLLLIDIQNDYFTGGKMELVNIDSAAANAQLLLNQFRTANSPIIHIKHISTRPGAAFFLPDTEGVEIHQTVAPLPGETIIEKNFPNSFRETNLLTALQTAKTESLIICGAMTHMCIDATTRTAFDHGYNCTVAHDACATRDLTFNNKTIKASDVHASFMAALSSPYAQILQTQEILTSLKHV